MPNTLDGTPIQIDNVYDGLTSHEGMAFEAAWNGKAIADGSGPVNIPVACLSKRRWSTLPLGGNCPLQLPDPRVDRKSKFCEDMDMEAKGALLYSSSSYRDSGLYTYTEPASQLRLTTASLVPQAQGLLPVWTLSPPPAGVPFPVAGQPVQFEATIFAAALPVTIPDTELVKLYSYHCQDDLITTTSELADPSCAKIAVEGYVYPRNAADRPARPAAPACPSASSTRRALVAEERARGDRLLATRAGEQRQRGSRAPMPPGPAAHFAREVL